LCVFIDNRVVVVEFQNSMVSYDLFRLSTIT